MSRPTQEIEISFGKKDAAIFALLAVVYLASAMYMLDRFPKVWIDSAWSAIAPYNLVTKGVLANPMCPQAGLDQHLLAPYVFQRLLLAATFKVFGFGIVEARVLSVLCGLVLLAITYLFSLRFFGRSVATIASIILVSDNLFFVSSRTVRADIVVALLSILSLFLFLMFLYGQRMNTWLILSGFVLGIATYTHPNALIFIVIILFLIFFDFVREKRRSRIIQTIGIFIFGFSIGFLPYVIYVSMNDWSSGFDDFWAQLQFNSNYPRSSAGDFLNSAWTRITNYAYFPYRIFIVLSQLIVVSYYLFLGHTMKRSLAITVILFLIFLPIVNQNPTSRYFVILAPILAILLACAYVDIMKSTTSNRISGSRRLDAKRLIVVLWLFLLLVNQAAGDAYALWKHRNGDYQNVIGQIREVIPSQSRIWGSVTFWYGLHDYPYRSQLTPVSAIREFSPEYVIAFDSELWGRKSATLGREMKVNDGFDDQRKAIESLIDERGTLIRSITDSTYGNMRIYLIGQE